VPLPQIDAFDLGIRSPTWVISPYAKQSYLAPAVCELNLDAGEVRRAPVRSPHARLGQRPLRHGHTGGANYEAGGGSTSGPPAPPRDAKPNLGDLFEALDFWAVKPGHP
jgi:hypothetical protein